MALPYFRSPNVSGQAAAGDSTSLPRCLDDTAYASLLSIHTDRSSVRTTALATNVAKAIARGDSLCVGSSPWSPIAVQLRLLLVLVRSLRRVERRCRRDFVIFGALPPCLPQPWRASLESEGAEFVRTPPLVHGSPAADKLHAWNLTQYARILVLDSDVMAIAPMEELLATSSSHTPMEARLTTTSINTSTLRPATQPGFVAARHESDLVQESGPSAAFHSRPQPSTAVISPPQPSTAFHSLPTPAASHKSDSPRPSALSRSLCMQAQCGVPLRRRMIGASDCF